MKNLTAFLLCCAALLAVSCHRREIKVCSAVVEQMTDTTMVTKIGSYSITFGTRQARYDNGAVMAGDSVIVHYVGDLKERHATAALIRLIPPKGNVVEAVYNPDKELETTPMSDEDAKKLDEFVRKVKEDRRKGIK